jgi:acyl-CoA synthetase (AMP-forming)/AMP-acid ligase II
MDIIAAISSNLRDRAHKRGIEFRGKWYTWGEIARIGRNVETLLREDQVAKNAIVGVVVRNRLGQASSLLGLVAEGRSIQMIYAFQPIEALAADLDRFKLTAVIASEQDWTPDVVAAAKRAGSLGISLSDTGDVKRVEGLRASAGASAPVASADGPALYILTSGTTGKPKNVSMPFSILKRAVISAALGEDDPEDPLPQIISWPFSGVGGVCQLMACGVYAIPFTLLEKFTVEDYMSAIRRHRPTWISITPAGLRMIYAADVPPEDMSSVKAIFGGSAALEADVQDAFEARYGSKIYWAYGATEFCGTIISWTPALRDEWGAKKRGSVGRPMKGVQIRVVDPETGAEVPPGTDGLLHALVPDINPDWIKTTDLVTVDADGFVFHRGRNDGAIVRGGFKIMPDKVAETLRAHPRVGDAAVIGISDARLGAVPVAAVEGKPGQPKPTVAELEAWIRKSLPATHVPVDWRIVDALPRTSSMKAMLGEVKKMFA